jgi:hypothetical protein
MLHRSDATAVDAARGALGVGIIPTPPAGPAPPVEPVGTREIAERLGVSRKAVEAWRTRNLGFREPRWTVGGRPAWAWDDVEDSARRTGRLPGAGRQ